MNKYINQKILKSISIFTLSSFAFGHGYIIDSRSYLCQKATNTNCGSVRYEPQSVEGPDRFPGTGPGDGKLASAAIGRFSQLDEQSSSRWKKMPIEAGKHTFTWHLTAVHRTKDWRYFITKDNWNPNEPLSASSFESQPFCTFNDNNQIPPVDFSHECTVPNKKGYHVIYAVWDVGDTASSFYQAVDVMFSGDPDKDDSVSDTIIPTVPTIMQLPDIYSHTGHTYTHNSTKSSISAEHTVHTSDIAIAKDESISLKTLCTHNSAAFEKLTNEGELFTGFTNCPDTKQKYTLAESTYPKGSQAIFKANQSDTVIMVEIPLKKQKIEIGGN